MSCGQTAVASDATPQWQKVLPGAYQMDNYLPHLEGQRVGLVVNHTSIVDDAHLVDTLLSLGVDVTMLFAPEHGFKGQAYNGEHITDGVYKGSIPIRSLHGIHKKPQAEDLKHVDILIFDIQDVGARFYTYISTLHYVMEAAAESHKKVIILDRPNPNAHYIDGPIMQPEFSSFIGKHPVPIVYGLTIGEYGRMINGEGWLKDQQKCKLMIVKNKHYDHDKPYHLPIAPSPNLPNQKSILLYPSLCLLEGTLMSEGRGTDKPFQQYGHPSYPSDYKYTPRSMTSSKYPKCQDQECGGVDLSHLTVEEIRKKHGIDLQYLLDSYRKVNHLDEPFFLENGFFEKLAGTVQLQKQIKAGWTAEDIRESWKKDLQAFEKVRAKYILY